MWSDVAEAKNWTMNRCLLLIGKKNGTLFPWTRSGYQKLHLCRGAGTGSNLNVQEFVRGSVRRIYRRESFSAYECALGSPGSRSQETGGESNIEKGRRRTFVARNIPVILAGDFNAEPGAWEIQKMEFSM